MIPEEKTYRIEFLHFLSFNIYIFIDFNYFKGYHEMCACVVCQQLSRVQLFVTPWTVPLQASLSMAFSRQEHWDGLPFPSPGDVHDPGIGLASLASPALQAVLYQQYMLHTRVYYGYSIASYMGILWIQYCFIIWVSSPQLLCKLFKESDLYLFILVSSTVPCFNENLH